MDYEKKVKEIIEFIAEKIEKEEENLQSVYRLCGQNNVMAGMFEGALDAYKEILDILNS